MSLTTEALRTHPVDDVPVRRPEPVTPQQRWSQRLSDIGIVSDDQNSRMLPADKQGIVAYVRTGQALNLVTAPIIYSLVVPLVVLDAWICAYQWVCFPIYGIERVRRRDYFTLDRQKLPYLNVVEKVGCTFCSYATGLIAFVREVTARTEEYWCPIRHASDIPAPHDRYQLFFDFGDGERYHRELMALRRSMRPSGREGRDEESGG